MHRIMIDKRHYDIPSKWEELGRDQYVRIADIVHRKISEPKALIRVFLLLCEVSRRPWLFWTIFVRITEEQRYDLLKTVRWVLEKQNTCTDNKVPYVRTRGEHGKRLAGPLSECRRFVFHEFIDSDMAYLKFFKATNEDERMAALDRLVAILYREPNPDFPKKYQLPGRKRNLVAWNGDPRIPYNPNLVEYQMEQLKKLPVGYKYAAFLFYHACHLKWEKDHPHIFKKATDEEAAGGGGWGRALMSLAGGALQAENMLKVNAMAALRELEDRIIEAERMESEMKQR